MKEPRISTENGLVLALGADFDGYASMKDELCRLDDNRYGIKYVFEVKDKLLSTRKEPMCADSGWFYVWEYKPNASVFFVRLGDSDTFDASDVEFHIKVGKLAFGQSKDKLALMTTLSEESMDIIHRLGEIKDADQINWEKWPR